MSDSPDARGADGGRTEPLLTVRDLSVQFDADNGLVRAVNGVSLDIEAGETVCIVGESGCGKTVTCESITRLLSSSLTTIDGQVRLDGRNLLELSDDELREIRGDRIGHVFQNPQGALNHVYTIGWQIVEAIQLHRDVTRSEARREAIELLDRVGIPDPATRVDDYPHQLSGGQKQRAMIAMALAPQPDLLIADEPTTALDVTIQAGILDLLEDLKEDLDMGILLVTHDLGVVATVADRVVVMYAGKVMERGRVAEIFESPAHPYTQALLECLPGRGRRTAGIDGAPPDPTDHPDGCRFHPRCPHAVGACRRGEQPPLYDAGSEHEVSCVYYSEGFDSAVVRGEHDGSTDGDGDHR